MKQRWIVLALLLFVIPSVRAQFTAVNQQSPVEGDFVKLADVNGDGLDDIVDSDSVRLNLGGGKFGPRLTPLPAYTRIYATLDYNGDGKADLITIDTAAIVPPSLPQPQPASSGFHLLRGNGDGTFTKVSDLQVAGDDVRVVDFDGDGKDDIIAFVRQASRLVPNQTSFYRSNGDGTFALTDQHFTETGYEFQNGPETNALSARLPVADVNHDGIPDVVFRSMDQIVFYMGLGNGKFQQVYRYFSGFIYAQALDIVDVDGDGNPDIAFMHGNDFCVLYGDGTGHFPRTATFVTGEQEPDSNAGNYSVGNFTGAQRQVAITTSNGTMYIVAAQPNGMLKEVTRVSTGLHFLVLAYQGRLEQPGKRDLLVAGFQQPHASGDYVAESFLTAPHATVLHHRTAGIGAHRPQLSSTATPHVEQFNVRLTDQCTTYTDTWSLAIDGAFRTDAAPRSGRKVEAAYFDGKYYYRVTPDGTDTSIPPAWGNFTENGGTAWGKDACNGWEWLQIAVSK